MRAPMLLNSLESGRSAQPLGGHPPVFSISHIPEKSGLPSLVLGVGASRFGNPPGVLGTPAVGYWIHWLERSAGSATKIAADAFMELPLCMIQDNLQAPPCAVFHHSACCGEFVQSHAMRHQRLQANHATIH